MAALSVYLKEQRIGRLFENGDAFAFAFDQEMVDNLPGKIVLSVSMPVRGEPYFHEARTFFEGLLPEIGVRETIARNLKLSPENTFGLLGALGRDSAGAIVLLPDGDSLDRDASVEWLDDQELRKLIVALPRAPLGITGASKVRLSLAGLQRKAVLVRSGDGTFGLPNDGAPSTHLLKPQYEDTEYPNLVYNESFCMQVAECVGLDVARSEIIFIDSIPCLLVERFDRSTDGAGLTRLHQEDLCQALGLPSGRKYQAEGGPSTREASDLIRDVSHLGGADVLRFVRAVIVNYVLGNADAHAKNFALLYGESGLRLAPLYDIVSTAIYPEVDKTMAMSIGTEFDPDAVSLAALEDFARDCGFSYRRLIEECRDTASKTLACAESVVGLMKAEGLHVPQLDAILELGRKRAVILEAT